MLLSALFRCFATYCTCDERWIAANLRSLRTVWRARTLPQTSLSRCVSCLAQELFTREETQVTAQYYIDCLAEEETERWRRMRQGTRTLVFRQHSCIFGRARDSRWHGLIYSTQRDVLGGAVGWLINIRVYVTATVPASHPEMYRRSTMNVDLLFLFPRPFHILLGREIRMRGQLLWEGTWASRGQSMSLMWVSFPGDARGLTGLVRMRRWIFESDFQYADRLDVMVSAFALQLCDIEARSSNIDEGEEEPQSALPRAARELRKRKNDKCLWWEGKRTGKYQRLSDDENEKEGPSYETVRPRDMWAMRHLEEARTLSLTRPSSSSADLSSLPSTNSTIPLSLPSHVNASSVEEALFDSDEE